jgi:hypothetical protein
MSLFDGVETEPEDWRDASLAHDRFIKTVVDPALRANVPVFQIIQEIRQISTPQANGKIAAFEELCRSRSREVHKEDAKRWRQEQSGTPAEQAPATAGREVAARTKAKGKSGLAGNFNTDLPRRYWVSPWLRFSIYVVIVSVMAIIVISEGADPRPVLLLAVIFLGIMAALSWTYFNRDWGK